VKNNKRTTNKNRQVNAAKNEHEEIEIK